MDIQIGSKSHKITIDGLTATFDDGLRNGIERELTDKHIELIAECILQTIYNLGIASESNIDYTLTIQNGTTYRTISKDGDVMVSPLQGEPYRRRIRNDRNIFKKKNEFDGNIDLPTT